uniref:Uncharacterized protein n=1 Tax=Romanomermis culicivorax TaxID=13658 RepID=A0A915L7Y1_ROMCU
DIREKHNAFKEIREEKKFDALEQLINNINLDLSLKIAELLAKIESLVKLPTLAESPDGLFDSQSTTSVYQKSIINPKSMAN